MFKNLFDFGYKRTAKEAIGFYFVYLLGLLVVAGLLGGIVGGLAGLFMRMSYNETYQLGLKTGQLMAPIVCFLISFSILREKGLLMSFIYSAIGISSVFLGFFLGGLGGLIPIAYLTTRESIQDKDIVHTERHVDEKMFE